MTDTVEASEALDLELFIGKKVTISLSERTEGVEVLPAETFDATVEAANDKAVMLKRKGKANIEFLDAAVVTACTLQEAAEPVVKARRQDPVTIDNIKRHLVDRHGYAVADINKMAATDAYSFHEGIDHAPLGHFHAVKEDKTED